MFALASDVTLIAVDCANPKWAARALVRSAERTGIDRCVLVSDIQLPGPFACRQIDAITDLQHYSRFMLECLHLYVDTPFALVIQWDGFVLDAQRWDDRLFGCDYVGARWPHRPAGRDIGNGGFSLRSQQLMAATTRIRPWLWEAKEEDLLIGVHRRRRLEQSHGIRFASPSLAERFSYEHGVPAGPTFGFHGIFNLWRHIEDWEALEISRRLGQGFRRKWSFLEWLVGYAETGRIGLARTLLAEAGLDDATLRKGISRQAGGGQRSLEVMAALGRA